MRVAIVGAGLVGRLAGWAAMLCGYQVKIFDRSLAVHPPRGFVYLHDSCELPLGQELVTVHLTGGDRKDYARKVYSAPCVGMGIEDVSFGKFIGTYPCYSPAEALSHLMVVQNGLCVQTEFKAWEDVLYLRQDYDRVVFTLPLNKFIDGVFPSKQVSVYAEEHPSGDELSNFCVYNADAGVSWYRGGTMFGYVFYEFTDVKPSGQGITTITKVMPGAEWQIADAVNVRLVGRYGKWNKGDLAHDAFYEVIEWLEA